MRGEEREGKQEKSCELCSLLALHPASIPFHMSHQYYCAIVTLVTCMEG